MENDDNQYFLNGLKTVIRRDWPTQEEFAKGVTSKVNLSNILREQTGTSQSMRQALAKKAGMTVEDVIAIGKGAAQLTSAGTRPGDVKNSSPGAPFGVGELSEMSSSLLLSKISDYSLDVTEQMATQAKTMVATIRALVEERNRVLRLWQREQKVSNSIDEAIKVVTKKFNIGYCNRAYSERYQQEEGDHCSEDHCISCKGACLAGKVFITGKSEHSLVEDGGCWFYKTAYPIPSPTGIIDNVVVVSREIDTLVELMREKGWECSYRGKPNVSASKE